MSINLLFIPSVFLVFFKYSRTKIFSSVGAEMLLFKITQTSCINFKNKCDHSSKQFEIGKIYQKFNGRNLKYAT